MGPAAAPPAPRPRGGAPTAAAARAPHPAPGPRERAGDGDGDAAVVPARGATPGCVGGGAASGKPRLIGLPSGAVGSPTCSASGDAHAASIALGGGAGIAEPTGGVLGVLP